MSCAKPKACPSCRFRLRCSAHRRLPSMMKATCLGIGPHLQIVNVRGPSSSHGIRACALRESCTYNPGELQHGRTHVRKTYIPQNFSNRPSQHSSGQSASTCMCLNPSHTQTQNGVISRQVSYKGQHARTYTNTHTQTQNFLISFQFVPLTA